MRTPIFPSRMLIVLALLASLLSLAHASDEAEFQVWEFKHQSATWNGGGPLPHGDWPIRDKAMRLTVLADAKLPPTIQRSETILPADRVNVIQIRVDGASATKCQLWFTTGASPQHNPQKMVEFDLHPGSGMQDYTLDLKSLASWRDNVASLRFTFLGARPGEELGVEKVKAFIGEKISTPMIYTLFRPGQKPVVREFRFSALFNHNMVLQRDKPVPVWGRAKPGETVTVEFAGQTKTGTADGLGKWTVRLDAMEACARPQALTARGDTEAHRVELKGVLVGDVWLCGGQSNMGGNAQENPPAEERRKELLETDYPNLRYVAMPGMHRDTPAPNDLSEDALDWRSVQANTRAMSAVGYYLGQAIHVSQKIPVGLLFTIKAGSQVEQWLDQETLGSIFNPEELKQTCGTNRLASGLYNGMVAPIPPFQIKGAMWYQGESNADNDYKTMGYYRSLPALIGMWRKLWGSDLPVLLVQLPRNESYPPDSWAHIREVQFLCATQLPRVATVVSFDEGDPKNLHPNNKYFIGSRLGLAARALVYGEPVDGYCPLFKAATHTGSGMEVVFNHVSKGLQARGELRGFELRDKTGSWVAAEAKIAGNNRVLVSSTSVTAPEAVRYAWGNSVPATLFNTEGLPASPFRSDTPVELLNHVKASRSSK